MNEQMKHNLYAIAGKLKLVFLIGITLLVLKLTIDSMVLFCSYIFYWPDNFHANMEFEIKTSRPFSSEEIQKIEEIETVTINSSDSVNIFTIKAHAPTTSQVHKIRKKFDEAVQKRLADGDYEIRQSKITPPEKSLRVFRLELFVYIPLCFILILYYRYLFRLYTKIKAVPAGKRLAVITEIKTAKKADEPIKEAPKTKHKAGKKRKKKR